MYGENESDVVKGVYNPYDSYDNYLNVSISKISNGFMITRSGYQNGRSISEQVFAADAVAVGSVISDIFG
jgi:hypothetical protein